VKEQEAIAEEARLRAAELARLLREKVTLTLTLTLTLTAAESKRAAEAKALAG
jgi:hypothetical protein